MFYVWHNDSGLYVHMHLQLEILTEIYMCPNWIPKHADEVISNNVYQFNFFNKYEKSISPFLAEQNDDESALDRMISS